MAWNLPDDQHGNKPKSDPWTGRDHNKPDTQPPHLESLLKDWWQKCRRRSWPALSRDPKTWWKSIVSAVVVVWLLLGLYHVEADHLAYVMRLGVYQGQLTEGWQWRAFGLYQVKLLPQPLRSAVTAEVMTQDLNLAEVSLTVDYRVNDPQAYLFNVQAPQAALQALAISDLQQTVGGIKLAVLLSEANPPAVTNHLSHRLQALADQAHLGVTIETVSISKVAIPAALQELFNKMNALYATQNSVKQKNAEYQQQVLVPAEAQAQNMIAQAKAYSEQAVGKAQADVSGFLALLPSYQQAPHVTEYRLYTETMKTLISQTPTVIVAAKGVVGPINMGDVLSKAVPQTPAIEAPPAMASPDTTAYGTAAPDAYANVKGGY